MNVKVLLFFCTYTACIVMKLSFALVIYTSLEIWTFHDTGICYHELLYYFQF